MLVSKFAGSISANAVIARITGFSSARAAGANPQKTNARNAIEQTFAKALRPRKSRNFGFKIFIIQSFVGRDAGDALADNQAVNVVRALVGVNRF